MKIILGVLIVLGIVFFIAAEMASRGAAEIFNYAMTKQKVLRGTVVAEKLWADPWGNVRFNNIVWTAVDGKELVVIPEGRIKVRPWDIVWRKFAVSTIEELELVGADINLVFDKDMKLDVIEMQKKQEEQKPATEPVKKDKQRNLVLPDNLPSAKLILKDVTLGANYDRRHFVLNDVNGYVQSGKKEVAVHLSAGQFGGTLVGDGFNIDGKVHLQDKQTVAMNIGLYNVVPSSLGMANANDSVTLTGEVKGELVSPTIDGYVEMKELNIPGFKFTKVQGNYSYRDGLIALNDVTAKFYGGNVEAYGLYHFDNRHYKINAKGYKINAGSVSKQPRLHCSLDVDINFHQMGRDGNDLIYGTFKSGKGNYSFVPFKSISGVFSNQNKELSFANVMVETDLGTVESQAFRIVNGKLVLHDIFFVETGGQRLKIR